MFTSSAEKKTQIGGWKAGEKKTAASLDLAYKLGIKPTYPKREENITKR